jgi:crossover junction endodeoxyribonuclease RuvC
MRVLGIDPGIAIVGYGIIDFENNKYKPVDYGAVTTEAGLPLSVRLNIVFTGITELINKYKPDVVSIEELFFKEGEHQF